MTDIGNFDGVKVSQMLSKVTKILGKATTISQDDSDAQMDTGSEFEGDDDYEGLDSEDGHLDGNGWSPGSPSPQPTPHVGPASARVDDSASMRALNSRIRRDLRIAKSAGFRVGHIGPLLHNCPDAFVTISCRVAKLGISEEALQAWDLDQSLYFLVLIRYKSGYKTLERLIGGDSVVSRNVEIRVGLSHNYKIQIVQAIDAFSQLKQNRKENKSTKSQNANFEGLYPLFIGGPLEELLNERLVTILKYRLEKGLSWGGSERFYSDYQGAIVGTSDYIESNYWEDDSESTKIFPPIVTADHLAESPAELSFPLMTMQFALRHLVRCTEFCLVCHCKVDMDFEALKPYVCSKPLCLYQYMALGFGPSIEHEIISQPHVVDLLVSFCYSSACSQRLSGFPVGMGLIVPHPALWPARVPQSPYNPLTLETPLYAATPASKHGYGYPGAASAGGALVAQKSSSGRTEPRRRSAKFDHRTMELLFPPGEKILRIGQWICLHLVSKDPETPVHCRVIEVLYPVVRLGTPIHFKEARSQMTRQPSQLPQQQTGHQTHATTHNESVGVSASQQFYPSPYGHGVRSAPTPACTPPPPSVLSEVEFTIYDQNFDDLEPTDKLTTICMLLNTLPSVTEMKMYLQSKNGIDTSLRTWHDRISPAALGMLRWIIASNRSCLIQVDDIDKAATKSINKSEERVSGMPQWMQFRFAQGAPDKEQRFLYSVRQEATNPKHPTIFAWHGSPISNWHGIVREGLHFRETVNGRAFGNGVYHAKDVSTSLSYSGSHRYASLITGSGASWPQSELGITEAIALNEIVNAPDQFVSKYPYLVVSQLDWIQSRYLFVKCSLLSTEMENKHPTKVYEQDPTWAPTGACGEKIAIPITVVSKSRRPAPKTVKTGNKKAKIGASEDDAILLSDDTEVEDLAILLSDEENKPTKKDQSATKKGKSLNLDVSLTKSLKPSQTDFRPGVLDHSTLPILAPPAYAAPAATRSLQRELNNTLKIQEIHPAHELGWYLNPNLVENVYQWIVELHSFDADLPLAQDLKKRKLVSVVLELRFGKDYPISPPFVRVIRPRFLSFQAGGGGHVTAGGALCMQLLTNSGWSAVSNIESVLLQVRLAISSTDPKPARLDPCNQRDYGVGEAIEAFVRACHTHGVSLPIAFLKFKALKKKLLSNHTEPRSNCYRLMGSNLYSGRYLKTSDRFHRPAKPCTKSTTEY